MVSGLDTAYRAAVDWVTGVGPGTWILYACDFCFFVPAQSNGRCLLRMYWGATEGAYKASSTKNGVCWRCVGCGVQVHTSSIAANTDSRPGAHILPLPPPSSSLLGPPPFYSPQAFLHSFPRCLAFCSTRPCSHHPDSGPGTR